MKTVTSELMKKLDLIQDIGSGEDTLVVSGTQIKFAKPVDELSRYIIAEIPKLYRAAVRNVNTNGLTEEDKELIRGDTKAYLDQFETMVKIYLMESECKKLVE